MAKRKAPRAQNERAAVNAREEILLLLFRDLSRHQQREMIIDLQAMFEANKIAKAELQGKPLRAVSNEEVRAAFKDAPPVVRR